MPTPSRRLLAVTLLLTCALVAPVAGAASADDSAGWSPVEDLTERVKLTVYPSITNNAGQVAQRWHDRSNHDQVLAVWEPDTGEWGPAMHWTLRKQRVVDSEFVRLTTDQIAVVMIAEHRTTGALSLLTRRVRADGTLTKARGTAWPAGAKVGYPNPLFVAATDDGGLMAATLGQDDTPIVKTNAGDGSWRRVDVPSLPAGDLTVALILLDPDLETTVVLMDDDDRIVSLHAAGGAWVEEVLDDEGYLRTSDQSTRAVGVGGDAVLTWNPGGEDQIAIASRVAGAWTTERLTPSENCMQAPFRYTCAQVGMAADGEVVAMWRRATGTELVSDVVLSRRDPGTGAWSTPNVLIPGYLEDKINPPYVEPLGVSPNGDTVARSRIRNGLTEQHFFRCLAGKACVDMGDPGLPNQGRGAGFSVSADGAVVAAWHTEYGWGRVSTSVYQ